MARPQTLKASRANAGLAAQYRAHLHKLIARMQDSYQHWIKQTYPGRDQLAKDASIWDELRKSLSALRRYWIRRFNEMAAPLAKYFSTAVHNRTNAQLKKILKDGGFTVQFQATAAMRDVMDGAIKENVALIKSIPKQYHQGVRALVDESVKRGRDLYFLSKQLSKQFGSTKDRAALIARDQNNKVSAAMQRARQLEVNIKQAVWMHSHAGKTPRPTHVANHGKVYDVNKGWFDPKEKKRVWPGSLINCRCFSKPVIPQLVGKQ